MSIQQLLLIDVPKVVPGSLTLNSGSGTFIVPLFNSLTIELWGGGASAGIYFGGSSFGPGDSGKDSTIVSLNLYARGGNTSTDGQTAPSGGGASGGSTNTGGQPGGAGRIITGTTNPYTAANGGDSGGGALGGTGATMTLPFFLPNHDDFAFGSEGNAPGAGAGGNAYFDYVSSSNYNKAISASGAGGGYCSRTYLATTLVVKYNDALDYVVGAAGDAFNAPGGIGGPGYNGGAGKIKFTWS